MTVAISASLTTSSAGKFRAPPPKIVMSMAHSLSLLTLTMTVSFSVSGDVFSSLLLVDDLLSFSLSLSLLLSLEGGSLVGMAVA